MGILFFERFSHVFDNRLDLIGIQFHRKHLFLTLGNGVGNLFIDVSLPELGVGEIAGTRAEVLLHPPCLNMSASELLQKSIEGSTRGCQ